MSVGGGAAMVTTQVAGGIRAGGSHHDPLTIPKPTIVSNFLSHLNFLPTSANFTSLFRSKSTNYSKLESVDGREDNRESGSYQESVFWSVPSRFEVENAITDLQSFMLGLNPSGLQLGWVKHILELYDPRMMQSLGFGRVCDAFHLLQTSPSVKRLVFSIATDKAVWDAILNNKAVQNLRAPLSTDGAKAKKQLSSEEEPELAAAILNWILDIIKTCVTELIGRFNSLMNEILHTPEKGKPKTEIRVQLEEQLRSSFLLSIVTLLIVVVTRASAI